MTGAGEQDAPGPPSAEQEPSVVTLVSAMSGIGRTNLTATLAWSLAASGSRVLVLDWGVDGAAVAHYLEPFQVSTVVAVDAVGKDLIPLLWSAAEPGNGSTAHRIDRFVPWRGVGHVDLVGGGPDAAAAADHTLLRDRLRAVPYDLVLIDWPTTPPTGAVDRIAALSDTVVVCLTHQPTAAGEGATLAAGILDEDRARLRVLPVLVRVDANQGSQRARRLREQFPSLPGVPLVIPFHLPHPGQDVIPLALAEPGEQVALTDGYQQLVRVLTGDVGWTLPVMPAADRRRYERGLGLSPDDPPQDVYLTYAEEDRAWADWLHDHLVRGGARVHVLPAGSPVPERASILAVVSAHLADAPSGAGVAQLLERSQHEAADQLDLVCVRVDADTRRVMPRVDQIDLSDRSEQEARSLVLRHFGLSSAGPDPDGSRFPLRRRAGEPSGFPVRNHAFVGRADELRSVRDRLRADQVAGPVLVVGPAGVGKSDVAREYGHRFAYDYDFIRWIPAHDRGAARAALRALAVDRELPGDGDISAVVTALERGEGGDRWLLVYDGVDDLEDLTGLVPAQSRHRHVVATARTATLDDADGTVVVGGFSRDDAVAMLRRQVRDLTPARAAEVVESVGRLPLALVYVAAWMRNETTRLASGRRDVFEAAEWSAREVRTRFDLALAGLPTDPGPSEQLRPVAAALVVCFGSLEQYAHGRLAMRLAEFCSFLSANGIGLPLLRSRPVLEMFISTAGDDGELIAADGVELDRVLWVGSTMRLFTIDWKGSSTLRMHRDVQSLLRNALSRPDRDSRRAAVLRGLARYAPTEAEEYAAERTQALAELGRHLRVSGALRSVDVAVRRWVVSQVRYAYRSGDPEQWQGDLADFEALYRRWRQETSGPAETAGLRQRLALRLGTQLANMKRALGQAGEALALSDEVLVDQRALLGPQDPRTLMTARGKGGDLRLLGDFGGAVIEDEIVARGLQEVLGPDHPETLMADHNLAASRFLSGAVPGALTLEESVVERHQRLGSDQMLLWWCSASCGVYERELGRYAAAQTRLIDAFDQLSRTRSDDHPLVLWVRRNIAVTERRLNNGRTALRNDESTYAAYRSVLGDDHPETIECQLSLAADHYLTRRPDLAVDLARRCLEALVSDVDTDHPVVNLYRVNLALFLRKEAPDEAVAIGAEGLRWLEERLGDVHPWSLAARLHQGGHRQASGEVEEGLRMQESARADCEHYLGPDHPYTSMARFNLEQSWACKDDAGRVRQAVDRLDLDLDIPRGAVRRAAPTAPGDLRSVRRPT